MTAATVRLRLFASARAATGTDEIALDLSAEQTIDAALARLRPAAGPAETPQLEQVLARCSFLVNGVATTDRSTVLTDGDVVDVMPPFAGG